MADDKFIALNVLTGTAADNGEATGKVCGSTEWYGKGPSRRESPCPRVQARVRSECHSSLKKLGAVVALFEIDDAKVEKLRDDPAIIIEPDQKRALAKYRYIIDATPQGGFIELDDMHPDAKIACPGMPLGLTTAASSSLKDRLIHDPLQIGVATMMTMALL